MLEAFEARTLDRCDLGDYLRTHGSAMAEIRERLGKDQSLLPGMVEYGGLYQQQGYYRSWTRLFPLAALCQYLPGHPLL
jgi:hypothetical protein